LVFAAILDALLGWHKGSVSNRIMYKFLKLGEDTRQQRSFFEPDIEARLVAR